MLADGVAAFTFCPLVEPTSVSTGAPFDCNGELPSRGEKTSSVQRWTAPVTASIAKVKPWELVPS